MARSCRHYKSGSFGGQRRRGHSTGSDCPPLPESADAGQGCALAPFREKSLALANDPDAYAFELYPDKFCPTGPGERISLKNPPRRRDQPQ